MDIEAIKTDLKALCDKHKIMIYANEDDPCSVIEGLLSMEEAEAGCPPERVNFDFVTPEDFKEW